MWNKLRTELQKNALYPQKRTTQVSSEKTDYFYRIYLQNKCSCFRVWVIKKSKAVLHLCRKTNRAAFSICFLSPLNYSDNVKLQASFRNGSLNENEVSWNIVQCLDKT